MFLASLELTALGAGLESTAHGQTVAEAGQSVTTQCQSQAQTFHLVTGMLQEMTES